MTKHPIYAVWKNMINRCHNEKSANFEDYGGRGITVCERWRTSANFLADMLPTYETGLTLERIDNEKGYSPDNCKWVTPQQQGRNKRNNVFLTYGGETLTFSDMARKYDLTPQTLRARLKSGWSVERALTQPVRK